MKKLGQILFPIYIIIAVAVLGLFIVDIEYHDKIKVPISDDTFFFIILPLLLITGIFSRIESYKIIWVKLIPGLVYLVYVLFATARDTGPDRGWGLVGAGVILVLMIGFAILSLLVTFIYRRFSGTK